MIKSTFESDAIAAAAKQKKAYDTACKKVLALKEISARILKAAAKEFKDCTIDEIISYMSECEIGTGAVDADVPSVKLDNSEDSTINEGTRFYDVKFTVKVPGNNGSYIYLIINIEAQNDFSPGYSIIVRGIYYCARLISSQYGTVFKGSDYDRIRKVYSIWVCTDPAPEYRNTITRYYTNREAVEGTVKFKDEQSKEKERKDYDKQELVLICLGDPDSEKLPEGGVLKLLSAIFSKKLSFPAIKIILENEYNIKMTEEVNEEVDSMCNLSEGIWRRGVAQGMEQGMAQGMEQGIAQGIEQGRAQGMAQGIKQGRAQGITQGIAQCCQVLLSQGMEFEKVAEMYKLSPEMTNDIRRYLEENNGFDSAYQH